MGLLLAVELLLRIAVEGGGLGPRCREGKLGVGGGLGPAWLRFAPPAHITHGYAARERRPQQNHCATEHWDGGAHIHRRRIRWDGRWKVGRLRRRGRRRRRCADDLQRELRLLCVNHREPQQRCEGGSVEGFRRTEDGLRACRILHHHPCHHAEFMVGEGARAGAGAGRGDEGDADIVRRHAEGRPNAEAEEADVEGGA